MGYILNFYNNGVHSYVLEETPSKNCIAIQTPEGVRYLPLVNKTSNAYVYVNGQILGVESGAKDSSYNVTLDVVTNISNAVVTAFPDGFGNISYGIGMIVTFTLSKPVSFDIVTPVGVIQHGETSIQGEYSDWAGRYDSETGITSWWNTRFVLKRGSKSFYTSYFGYNINGVTPSSRTDTFTM